MLAHKPFLGMRYIILLASSVTTRASCHAEIVHFDVNVLMASFRLPHNTDIEIHHTDQTQCHLWLAPDQVCFNVAT